MNKSTYKYKFLKKHFNFNNKVITYLNKNNIDIHIFLYSLIPKYLSFLGKIQMMILMTGEVYIIKN